MASLEIDPASGRYRVRFRYSGQEYKRSLRTSHRSVATAGLGQVAETLRLLEMGLAELPSNVDPGVFIVSGARTRREQRPHLLPRPLPTFLMPMKRNQADGPYDAEIDRVQDQIDYLSYVPGIGGAIADATNIVIDLNQGQYGSAGSRALGYLGGELFGAAINGASKGASAVGKGAQDLMKGADNAASSASKQAAKVAGRNADELASKVDDAAEGLSKQADDVTMKAADPVKVEVESVAPDSNGQLPILNNPMKVEDFASN